MQPEDVVSVMCGAHAQVISAAELSVGLRLADATRADVRTAVWEDHRLVKTYGPRGTVHLLATRDLPLWTAALSAVPQGPDGLPEEARLTPEQTDAVVEAVATVLADRALTVDELTQAVVDLAGPWAGDRVVPAWYETWPRWRQAIQTAARRGALCFGPNRGRTVTYTSPRRWLPGFAPADETAAVAWIVCAYLHAYGPATPAQFAQWLGAPRRWAAERFDALAGELQRVDVDGAEGWVVAGDTAPPGGPPPRVRLLPYFDAYAVGSHPRDRLFPGSASQRALSGGQSGAYPVLLIDGVVAGVWHQRRSGRRIHVTVEPLDRLTAAQRRDLDDQVERVGTILEGRPELTVGAVTVGPHA